MSRSDAPATTYSLLRELCEAHAAPGFEELAADIFAREALSVGAHVEKDGLGSVFARLGSSGPSIMVDTHLDALSLVVADIGEGGQLVVNKLGMIHDARTLPGKRVTVHGRSEIPGVIAFDGESGDYPRMEQMWVDVGADSRRRAEALGVRTGDPVTMHWPTMKYRELANGLHTGFGLDYAAPTFIILNALRALAAENLPCSVWAVGHTQAEINSRGAGSAAYRLRPDAALLIEVEHVRAEPYELKEDVPQEFEGGPVIRRYIGLGGRNGFVSDARMQSLLLRVAEQSGIPHQLAVGEAMHAGIFSRGSLLMTTGSTGVPTAFIRLPIRYKHSPSEACSALDMEACTRLLVEAVRELALGRLST